MIKQCIALIAIVCVSYSLAAQKDQYNKWKFESVTGIELVQGSEHISFQVQSVNGIVHKNVFAGVGVGLDYYRYRSLPLFAELKKYFGRTQDQFFIYGDIGTHFIKHGEDINFTKTTYKPGLYSAIGLGFKTGFKNGMGIVMSGGYSYKKVNELHTDTYPCMLAGGCNVSDVKYEYNLHRLILQIAWLF